jgi:DNA-binding CsgD family transcriptional regulator
MTPGFELATLVSGTRTPTLKDREPAPMGSLLSQREACYAGDRATQPSGRVSDSLTPRERDVLAMISQGLSNKRIARALELSPETVKSHVKHIFLKLEVSTRTEAVFRALSLELAGVTLGLDNGESQRRRTTPRRYKDDDIATLAAFMHACLGNGASAATATQVKISAESLGRQGAAL